jgi:hypothetical protein
VAEFLFTREFLTQLGVIEATATPEEIRKLDRGLAEIAKTPELPDRFASHYDPDDPSYIVRRDPFLIRYSTDRRGRVMFRTLFRRSG